MRGPLRIARYFSSPSHEEQISSWIFPGILVIFCGVFYASYWNFFALPTPNLSEDLSLPKFNARNARVHLDALCAVGPRVGGSHQNEYFATDYIYKTLANQTASPLGFQYSKQVVMHPIYRTTSSSYQGVKNVVARIKGSAPAEWGPRCLLINSHYDTVAESPGGGDATTMIAVMLETLRVLLSLPEGELESSIIFLFNGGEEDGFLGAHAFMTEHKWASCVKAVINLDSAGNGGREILFQASQGHSWLMKHYQKAAPHPFTSSLGEELFQWGLIPSDTDFRVFDGVFGIPGMDLAYTHNGYVYHTTKDTAFAVPDGTLQHTGDNLLALIRELANAKELSNSNGFTGESQVFWDFMNLFMVSYSKSTAGTIHVVLVIYYIVVQIVMIYLNHRKWKRQELIQISLWSSPIFIVFCLLGLILGAGLTFALGYIYPAVGLQMTWYNNTFLIFLNYLCPMLFCMSLLPAIGRKWTPQMRPWDRVEHAMNLHSWLLMGMLLVATFSEIRSAFMLLVPLAFYALSLAIFCTPIQAHWKLLAHYVIQLFPFAFFSTWAVVAFGTFIPISGRNGVNSNSEEMITYLALGMGFLLSVFLIPTVSMYKSPIAVSSIFGALWIVGVILSFTQVGFPYSAKTPQRISVRHVQRTFYSLEGTVQSDESLFYIAGSDPNHEMIADYLKDPLRFEDLERCEDHWACRYPAGISNSWNYFLKAPSPIIDDEISIINTGKFPLDQTWELMFFAQCPSHCTIYVLPGSSRVRLIKWSFYDAGDPVYPNKTLYSTNFYNFNQQSVQFTVQISVPDGPEDVLVKAGITAQLRTRRYRHAPEFNELISSFPDWTTVEDWTSVFKSYEF